MPINNAYELANLNLSRLTKDQMDQLLPGIEKEFKLLISIGTQLSARKVLSPFAKHILKRCRQNILSLMKEMKNFYHSDQKHSGLSRFFKTIKPKLLFYWFCLTIIEHETNWESPSQCSSLFPAKGYNNIGGIYRRYSLAGGAAINFADFRGQRIFFNGENAIHASLKSLLWPYYHRKSILFIIDKRLEHKMKSLVSLFKRRFGWRARYVPSAFYAKILKKSISERQTNTFLLFICLNDNHFTAVSRGLLKRIKHIITIDSIDHSKKFKKDLLRNENRIYFSTKIYKEKVAIVYPEKGCFDSFIFHQQRGGSLNEWSLKFFSFLYDDHRYLQLYNHEYFSPVWAVKQNIPEGTEIEP